MKLTKLIGVILFTIIFMNACTEKKDSNPILESWNNTYNVPPFEKITVDNYRDAFQKGMEENNKEIEAIINNSEIPSFENTIIAFDASGQLLDKVSRIFFAEAGSNGTKGILELESEIVPQLTKHNDNILMNGQLFGKVKQVYENVQKLDLSPEDSRLLEEVYISFVRNGAMLSDQESAEFKNINEELSVLENKFSQNLLSETASFQLVIDKEDDLSGLSEDVIKAASNRAEKENKNGKWIFGLDNPSIMPFLYFDDNKELRNTIFTAYLNRCNNNNEYDNKEVLKKIIVLRDRKANMLGYKNFADFALDRRMAKKSENVYNLLDRIWSPSLKKAQEELNGMQEITDKSGTITSSDWRYYSEKLKAQKYNLSEEELRPYFKAENAREGIFWVSNQLYGITFKQLTDTPKPHVDSEAFVCMDKDGVTELGVLYIDLYARPGLKRGGAWCGSYRSAYQDEKGKRVLPITYITCNFTSPLGDEPALLTPDEVETFFHEFGHALHNLFRNVKYHSTGRVPWDFVELPSQIMEHWAFEPLVLANYAKHYQTGEVIPSELIDKMQAASKYGQGFATTEYLAASYLDMDYHVNEMPSEIQVSDFEKNTLAKRGLLPQIPPRYRSTYFQHIFSGGYSAGYYSYIWSEVLDTDAYEAFVESGNILNKEIADKFRKYILEPGGIYPADKMYENFRGKQPDINALLRNRGLQK